jgi:hypothetical protein
MTAFTMQSMIKRAVKEGVIWKMGIPKSYDGIHSTLYATSDHKLIKEKIPTIKNLYEKMIVKFVMAKDGSVTWPDLKEFAFQKYGSTIPKFRKAFNNLLSKKYLIYDGKTYTLNKDWDYQRDSSICPGMRGREKNSSSLFLYYSLFLNYNFLGLWQCINRHIRVYCTHICTWITKYLIVFLWVAFTIIYYMSINYLISEYFFGTFYLT